MANKVNVEISANITGFKQGMQQATESAQQYQTETRKISESLTSFNKQMRDAKREVQNLALAYSKLSKEEKQSNFGLEMKTRLDAAKKSAAEFVDMQGDMQTELKNLASDTRVFDTMAEGLTIASNVASGALGIYAQLTGEEEDAKRAMVAFTTAQSVLNAATTIHNALQKQSQTMLAVTKVQTLAATAAVNLKTAAEGKGVVTTKAATVAQRIFNAVASANPYVLLAGAILTLIGALGAYIAITKKSETETDKQKKKLEELKKTWDGYRERVANNAANIIAQYKALQNEWLALKTTQEKDKFLEENKSKFEQMGFAIDNVNELEKLFVTNTAAVVKSLKARAEAEAWGEIYKEELKKKFTKDLNPSTANNRRYRKAHAGDYISAEEAREAGINIYNKRQISTSAAGASVGGGKRAITEQEAAIVNNLRNAKAVKKLREENDQLSKIEKKQAEAVINSNKAVQDLDKSLTTSIKTKENSTKTTKEQKIVLEKLEDEVKKYQKELGNINIKAPNYREQVNIITNNLKKAQQELTKYKISVGLEVDSSDLDKLEEKVKEKELLLRADIPQEDKDRIYQETLELKDEIQKLKIQYHIEPDPSIEDKREVKKKISDILKSVNVEEKPSWNFDNIAEVNPEQAKMLDKMKTQYDRVYDARQQLMDLMNEEGASDTQISKAQEELEKLNDVFNGLTEKLDFFKRVDDNLDEQNKAIQKTIKSLEDLADYLELAGNAFSNLSQIADDDKTFNVMGIVAQAIATVALSYAKALASTRTWVDWLAFGVTGLGTMLSMIAQIKQATSGYANGGPVGLVGGSSYGGDHVLARLNSGEMVLNKHQQQNLFDAINSGNIGNNNNIPQSIEVYGRIKGTDILLSNHNTQKVMSRSGLKIHN